MLKILINNLITGIRLLPLSMCCAGVTFLYEEVLTAELNRTDGIQFNEILASNLTGLKDEDGDTSDWLEIKNIRSQTVNLSGYSLTDNARVRRKWPLPDQDIPPGGYFSVWMSGKDSNQSDLLDSNPLGKTSPLSVHTNFKLKKKGGSLFLINPAGDTIDEIHYPKQYSDHSFARSSDPTRKWGFYLIPTPGKANEGRPLKQFVKEPSFFPLPSVVYDEIEVHLNVKSIETVELRYTTDGSHPTGSSLLYDRAIKIIQSATIRVAAFIEQERVSPIATGSYLIKPEPQLPSLSITLPPADFREVHMNSQASGRKSERQAYWEYFNKSGKRIEATGFGLRIHGGAGRNGGLHTKKSYRAYFRSSYGQSRLNGEIIPNASVKAFDKLVLRASSNDRAPHGSSIRDQVIRDLHLEMGGVGAHGSWCVLYVNGVNRGIYNITERMDQIFLSSHLGEGQFDVIKTGETLLNGNKGAWNHLNHFLRTTQFSDAANYEELKRRVDVENFTSYVILNLCMQNFDWPHNNWYAARRIPDGKWIFMCWDAEWGLGYRHPHSGDAPIGIDLDPYAFMDSGGAYGHGLIRTLFLALLNNEAYRKYYQQEVTRYLKESLSTENILRLIRYHRDAIETEMKKEYEAKGTRIKRWHDQIHEIEVFTKKCTTYFKRYTDEYFDPVVQFNENRRLSLVESANGKRYVFYRGDNGQIYHFSSTMKSKSWLETAVYLPKGAPSIVGNPAAYSLASGKLIVVYRGRDGDLHELTAYMQDQGLSQWSYSNLSSTLTLPPAINDPTVIVADGTPHVFYLDKNLQPQELWLNSVWHHHPLPVAPRPGGDITATASAGGIYVTYRTVFGAPCTQRLARKDQRGGKRSWQHELVLQVPAAGTPAGLMADGKWRVIFRPAKVWPLRQPYVFHWDGPQGKGYQDYKGSRVGLIEAREQRHRFCHLQPITSRSGHAAGNPIVLSNARQNRHYVTYRDSRGHLQEAYLSHDHNSDEWHIQDITHLSNAPAAMSDPVGMTLPTGNQRYYIYWGVDKKLHELHFDGRWNHIPFHSLHISD
ncbi:MAG: CotH kinase family protein [Limisphaerales bacterium]